jgi:hypothetical protein
MKKVDKGQFPAAKLIVVVVSMCTEKVGVVGSRQLYFHASQGEGLLPERKKNVGQKRQQTPLEQCVVWSELEKDTGSSMSAVLLGSAVVAHDLGSHEPRGIPQGVIN